MEFESFHIIFKRTEPITEEQLRSMFDDVFVDMMLELPVGGKFETTFRIIKRVK